MVRSNELIDYESLLFEIKDLIRKLYYSQRYIENVMYYDADKNIWIKPQDDSVELIVQKVMDSKYSIFKCVERLEFLINQFLGFNPNSKLNKLRLEFDDGVLSLCHPYNFFIRLNSADVKLNILKDEIESALFSVGGGCIGLCYTPNLFDFVI